MKRIPWCVVLAVLVFSSLSAAQLERIVIPAGTPEDQALQDISKESDAQKKLTMYQDFLEGVGFNAIAHERDAKKRMSYLERFSAGFPNSQYQEQISQYVMYTLGPGQLNDPARLVAFGEKSLAANPNGIPALLLLSNFYVEDSKPASVAKAVTYAQKVVTLAKANEADADRSHKLSAGVAHSTLGYAYMKQEKTAAAVPEFKSAAGLLKGQDDLAYAT